MRYPISGAQMQANERFVRMIPGLVNGQVNTAIGLLNSFGDHAAPVAVMFIVIHADEQMVSDRLSSLMLKPAEKTEIIQFIRMYGERFHQEGGR